MRPRTDDVVDRATPQRLDFEVAFEECTKARFVEKCMRDADFVALARCEGMRTVGDPQTIPRIIGRTEGCKERSARFEHLREALAEVGYLGLTTVEQRVGGERRAMGAFGATAAKVDNAVPGCLEGCAIAPASPPELHDGCSHRQARDELSRKRVSRAQDVADF